MGFTLLGAVQEFRYAKIAIFEPPSPHHHALSRLFTRSPCIAPRLEQTHPSDAQCITTFQHSETTGEEKRSLIPRYVREKIEIKCLKHYM